MNGVQEFLLITFVGYGVVMGVFVWKWRSSKDGKGVNR